MRLLALLLAAVALPLVLVVGLLAGLAIGLASWAADEAPRPPADLVPLYQEASRATGVPWTAIAAIDGAANGFDLPVPPPMHWFLELYHAEEERLRAEWRWRCEVPEPVSDPPPGCDHPPVVPDTTIWRLWQQARTRHQAALRAHIRANADRLQARLPVLTQNPEDAYDGLVPDGTNIHASDLYLGYTLLAD